MLWTALKVTYHAVSVAIAFWRHRDDSLGCIALCFVVHKISSMAARHSVCTARSQRCSLKWKSEKSWLCDIYSSFCGMVASNKHRMPLIIAIYDAASLLAALKAVADERDPMAVSVNYKILYHRGDGWIDAEWAWSGLKRGYVGGDRWSCHSSGYKPWGWLFLRPPCRCSDGTVKFYRNQRWI